MSSPILTQPALSKDISRSCPALGKAAKTLKAIVLSRSTEPIRSDIARVTMLFPSGSCGKPSEALPGIDAPSKNLDARFAQFSEIV